MTNHPDSATSTGDGWNDRRWTTTYTRTWRGRPWKLTIEWWTWGGTVAADSVTLTAPVGESVSPEAWRQAVPVGEALRAGRKEAAQRIREEMADAPEAPKRTSDGGRDLSRSDLAWALEVNVDEPRRPVRPGTWDHELVADLYNQAVGSGDRYPVKTVRERLAVDPDGRPLTAADHKRVRGAVAYARKLGLIPGRHENAGATGARPAKGTKDR